MNNIFIVAPVITIIFLSVGSSDTYVFEKYMNKGCTAELVMLYNLIGKDKKKIKKYLYASNGSQIYCNLILFPPFITIVISSFSAYLLRCPILQTVWTQIRLLFKELFDQG